MRDKRKSTSNPMKSPITEELNSDTVTHRSVLLHSSLDILDIKPYDTVVDATLGGSGHAKAIADRLGGEGAIIGFDLDHAAIVRAEHALAGTLARRILIEDNFRNIESQLDAHNITFISKALFDLGWSQFQLTDGRGFSFLKDEPLLMTYTATTDEHQLTAKVIVNTWAEDSIASVIYGWGEEHYSRRIARAIVEYRKKKPITTSLQLGEIIRASVPVGYAKRRIHPATKSFQALRIAVNDELGAVEHGLLGAWRKLDVGGRIAVISFHSIEDRVVKYAFQKLVKEKKGKLVNKKPIIASREELKENPRARSAKLRCIEKIA